MMDSRIFLGAFLFNKFLFIIIISTLISGPEFIMEINFSFLSNYDSYRKTFLKITASDVEIDNILKKSLNPDSILKQDVFAFQMVKFIAIGHANNFFENFDESEIKKLSELVTKVKNVGNNLNNLNNLMEKIKSSREIYREKNISSEQFHNLMTQSPPMEKRGSLASHQLQAYASVPELPHEMITEIVKNIETIKDLIRFGGVSQFARIETDRKILKKAKELGFENQDIVSVKKSLGLLYTDLHTIFKDENFSKNKDFSDYCVIENNKINYEASIEKLKNLSTQKFDEFLEIITKKDCRYALEFLLNQHSNKKVNIEKIMTQAVTNGSKDVVNFMLMPNKSKFNWFDLQFYIKTAFENKNEEVAALLFNKLEADSNRRHVITSMLESAIQNENNKMVEFIFNNISDINIVDKNELLMNALERKQFAIADLFLKHEADPDEYIRTSIKTNTGGKGLEHLINTGNYNVRIMFNIFEHPNSEFSYKVLKYLAVHHKKIENNIHIDNDTLSLLIKWPRKKKDTVVLEFLANNAVKDPDSLNRKNRKALSKWIPSK